MRLSDSLKEIDLRFDEIERNKEENGIVGEEKQLSVTKTEPAQEQSKVTDFELLKNEVIYSIYEAKISNTKKVEIEKSQGTVSAEFLYLYPPGIPLLVPGEVISKELLNQIDELKRRNMNINGLRDKKNRYIEVVRRKVCP